MRRKLRFGVAARVEGDVIIGARHEIRQRRRRGPRRVELHVQRVDRGDRVGFRRGLGEAEPGEEIFHEVSLGIERGIGEIGTVDETRADHGRDRLAVRGGFENRREVAIGARAQRLLAGGRPLDATPDRAVPQLHLLDPAGGGRSLAARGLEKLGVIDVDRQSEALRGEKRDDVLWRRHLEAAAVVALDRRAGRRQHDPLRRLALEVESDAGADGLGCFLRHGVRTIARAAVPL